ncbi:MAG: GDP-L-fucose synthase, partial [Sphingobacteriaceae bacterium]|nr:GDP-L-fucose synthase [Sphingobacteriaceae bacterium]
NIGSGKDLTIKELSAIIQEQIGYQGKIEFDTSKPDGTMKKLQDVSKLHGLGWKHKVMLNNGISDLIKWYLD